MLRRRSLRCAAIGSGMAPAMLAMLAMLAGFSVGFTSSADPAASVAPDLESTLATPTPPAGSGASFTIGPTSISVAQPNVGQALSGLQPVPAPLSIDVRAGSVGKTVAPGRNVSMPLDAGMVEVAVRFPYNVGMRAVGVKLEMVPKVIPPAPAAPWQLELREQPAPDTVAFTLRGQSAANMNVSVTPVPGAPPVQFGLHMAPGIVVGRDDANQTVQLAVGDRFVLDPGQGYLWQVAITNETVVGRVPDMIAAAGQGTYEAKQPGHTTLTVMGDPPCRRGRLACMVPSLYFDVQIIVG